MKKLLALSLIGTSLILGSNPTRADYIIPKGTTYETTSDNFAYSSGGNTFEILKDLNLTVNDGECICIIGKSGIGKSILLKHITGLMVPDSGEVWLHDEMINSLSFKELQKIRSKMK